jgi:short-subunit dehydrogenase
VVGLTSTLRVEALRYGVNASVVCPGFVDTPLLYENLTIKDRGRVPVSSRDEMKKYIRLRAMPVDDAAREILTGVQRNKAVIVVTGHAKVMWGLQRLYPPALHSMGRLFVRLLERGQR